MFDSILCLSNSAACSNCTSSPPNLSSRPLAPAADRHRGDAMTLFLQELCSHEPLGPTQHPKYSGATITAVGPSGPTLVPPATAPTPAATLRLRVKPTAVARQHAEGLLARLASGKGGKGAAGGGEGGPPAWVECALEVRGLVWGVLVRLRGQCNALFVHLLCLNLVRQATSALLLPLCTCAGPAGRCHHHPDPARRELRLQPARAGAGRAAGRGEGRAFCPPLHRCATLPSTSTLPPQRP